LLIAIMMWRGTFRANDAVVVTIGYTLVAIGFGALLVHVLHARPRAFSGRVLPMLGRYSYALYIVHNPVLYLVGGRWFTHGVPVIGGSQLPGELAGVAMAGGLSMALSIASWHLLEKHFLALKRWFPYGGARHAVAARQLGDAGGGVAR
jgi:peptidoglycan/LPS O-acetylase OafA/YrhL